MFVGEACSTVSLRIPALRLVIVAHEEIGKTRDNRHGAVCEMEDFASSRLVLIRGMVQ